jgi:hypothetical protein
MSDGRIRPIMRFIHEAEKAADNHQLKAIAAKDLK